MALTPQKEKALREILEGAVVFGYNAALLGVSQKQAIQDGHRALESIFKEMRDG